MLRPCARAARPPVFLLLALLGASASAQVAPSALVGTVVDAKTGEPLIGASVYLNAVARGASTDVQGRFAIRGLAAGRYAVAASYTGYETLRRDSVDLAPGQTRELRLALRTSVGQLGEVTVTYERPLIQPDALGTPRRSAVGIAPAPPPSPGDQVSMISGPPARAVAPAAPPAAPFPGASRDQYAAIDEIGFRRAADAPHSTFGVDVDRASYANVRRFLQAESQLPPPGAVRLEEVVNAFDYGLAGPTGAHPLRIETERAACPWAPGHELLRVSLQARRVEMDALPPVNLVMLLDVSGSMASPDKLPLVQQAMRMLAGSLRPQDRVAIVVYAGASGVVLPPTPGTDRAAILGALDRLQAGGSTAGADGIRLAYALARQHFQAEGVNRIVLATDGDFNVGVSSDAELLALVERERQSGVLLSVLGVGRGNLQDARAEMLANRGNGQYSYLDSAREAERVLVREVGATLVALVKDVKIQVEFNPATVAGYRLLGYENRALATEDFANDARDAGEMGAGHTVTALYEVVPAGRPVPGAAGPVERRYQTPRAAGRDRAEIAHVRVRYKAPTAAGGFAEASTPMDVPVAAGRVAPMARASEALRFASAAAEAALVLGESAYAPGATLEGALRRARTALGDDPHGDRAEFVRLLETARWLTTPRSEPTALRD